MALVDWHMEGCLLYLYHVYQGWYVDMYEIELDGVEHKICRDYVDELCMVGKPGKLKKVGHSTVYRTEESEEEE